MNEKQRKEFDRAVGKLKYKPGSHYEPTEEEIAESIKLIQSTWTESERQSRKGITTRLSEDKIWTPPVIHAAAITDNESF